MRVEPELTYQDYKEGILNYFGMLGKRNFETAEKISDWMTD